MFAQGAAATPVELLRGMTAVGAQKNVNNVRLFHMHLEGEAPFASKEVESTSSPLNFLPPKNQLSLDAYSLYMLFSFVYAHT